MKIDYDPQADAMYIQFREGEVDDTLEEGVFCNRRYRKRRR